MGFLDKAKKLAEQAKDAAEQAKRMAGEAANDARNRMAQQQGGGYTAPAPPPPPPPPAPGYFGAASPPPPVAYGPPGSATPGGAPGGTPYVQGMFGRPGWREWRLADPAGVLPIDERDRAGVPHSVKSQILEEPYGMGRRWSAGERSAALFYQLYPEHRAWEPPGGREPYPPMAGAAWATLADGRALVFLSGHGASVVLEVSGIDEPDRSTLAHTVVDHLGTR